MGWGGGEAHVKAKGGVGGSVEGRRSTVFPPSPVLPPHTPASHMHCVGREAVKGVGCVGVPVK